MAINTFPSSSDKQLYRQYFHSSGTWTVPNGVTTATVTCVGGGGGAGNNTYQAGGGGGVIQRVLDVSGSNSYTVTVGAGGTSSTASKAAATDGGTSSFGSLLSAYGGQGAASAWSISAQPSQLNASGHCEDFTTNANGVSTGKWLTYGNRVNGSSGAVNSWLAAVANYQYSPPQQIAYNGTNLYVATSRTNNVMWTSPNGYTWTSNATTTGANSYVGWNGTYFVMVPSSASNTTAYYSTNGTTWTTSTLPSSQTWVGSITTTALSVAWNTTNTSAAYSTNGTTWTAVTLPAIPISMSLANGRIYMIGAAGATYYTTNGTTWTAAGTTAATINFVNYNATSGTYLAYGAYNATTYYYSTNGTTWTSRTWTTAITGRGASTTPIGFYGPVVVGSQWLLLVTNNAAATGANKFPTIWSSTDGINWTYRRSWTEGINTSVAGGMYPYLGQDVFSAGTNRYMTNFAISQDNSATWFLETVVLTEYLIAGNEGMAVPTANFGYSIGGGAGAGSTATLIPTGTLVSNGNSTVGSSSFGAGSGVVIYGEEFGKGGRGYTSAYAYGTTTYSYQTGHGEGAPMESSVVSVNGGDGVVIVEWWA